MIDNQLLIDIPVLKSGIPKWKDYQQIQALPFYKQIETNSKEFLEKLKQYYPGNQIKSWPWPLDPFQTWSRKWEYPFCISQALLHGNDLNHKPRLLDLGSGLTFLPYYFANLDWEVTCCDHDRHLLPIFQKLGRSDRCKLDIQDITRLQYPDESFDIIFCISVLEHLPVPLRQDVMDKTFRILKNDGILLLTFDIPYREPASQEEVSSMLSRISNLFQSDIHGAELVPELFSSPDRFLTTEQFRFQAPHLLPWKSSLRHSLKLLSQGHRPQRPFNALSIFCLAIVKREPTS